MDVYRYVDMEHWGVRCWYTTDNRVCLRRRPATGRWAAFDLLNPEVEELVTAKTRAALEDRLRPVYEALPPAPVVLIQHPNGVLEPVTVTSIHPHGPPGTGLQALQRGFDNPDRLVCLIDRERDFLAALLARKPIVLTWVLGTLFGDPLWEGFWYVPDEPMA